MRWWRSRILKRSLYLIGFASCLLEARAQTSTAAEPVLTRAPTWTAKEASSGCQVAKGEPEFSSSACSLWLASALQRHCSADVQVQQVYEAFIEATSRMSLS